MERTSKLYVVNESRNGMWRLKYWVPPGHAHGAWGEWRPRCSLLPLRIAMALATSLSSFQSQPWCIYCTSYMDPFRSDMHSC